MTNDELQAAVRLAEAIDNFDQEAAMTSCRLNGEPPYCLDCNGEYHMATGDDPTPLCDSCAHKNATDFARALLALHAENERLRAVYEAALHWADCEQRDLLYDVFARDMLSAIDRLKREVRSAIDPAKGGR